MPAHAVPAAVKALAGTTRPDRPEPPLPSFDVVTEFPPPPQHLEIDGATMWKDLGPQLVRAGVLQVVDLYPLEQLCYAWSRHRKKARAGVDITASEDNALNALFSTFGIGPAARRRVLGAAMAGVGSGGPVNRFASNVKRSA